MCHADAELVTVHVAVATRVKRLEQLLGLRLRDGCSDPFDGVRGGWGGGGCGGCTGVWAWCVYMVCVQGVCLCVERERLRAGYSAIVFLRSL